MGTVEGIAELAKLVRESRGDKSVRDFAKEAHLSEATISRIENGLTADPKNSTFVGLARVTHRSEEDLRAIANSKNLKEVDVQVAEDLLPLARKLSPSEIARLIQILAGWLSVGDMIPALGPVEAPMSDEQLLMALQLISDRIRHQAQSSKRPLLNDAD